MIKTEIKDNIIHTWSDLGMKIHGGFPEADYDEAYDPVDMHREYVETDILIESDTDAEEIINILTGESE